MSKSLKKLIDINRLREFKNKLVGMLSNYVTLNGDQTISGAKTLSADTLTGLAGNGYRIINGSSKSKVSTGYGVFQKVDSNAWYLMVTAKDDALGSWTTARPAQMALSTGILNINGNAATATKATGNANGKELTNTIIKGLSISGKTITYTQIDGNTGTLTTQDTVYTHPTTAGNKHIPSGGSSGQFLGWASDGTAKWVNNPNTNTDTLMTQNVSTTNATYPVLLVATADATANQGAKTGIFAKSVKVNPSTNVVSASGFSGPLTGNVTGNCSGSSGSCTGNAATATKLATARSLWGNNFDGSAAITGAITGTPSIEFNPPRTTSNNGGFLDFHYNQSMADYTSRIIESASGTLSINNVTITTGKVVTATTFNGALTGNVTGNCSGSSGSCTGNAATATTATTAKACSGNAASATKLQTARSLWGNNFDGSQNLSGNIHFTNDDLTGVVVGAIGKVGNSDCWRVGGGATADDSGFMELATADNGNEPIYVRQYTGEYGSYTTIARTATLLDASGNTQFPGTVTATAFYGNITGNVTGNCSGSSGSCTGNAATATTATTAKACTGNAATATKLAAKRTIALSGAATGTATGFDGSGNITIPVTALASSAIRAQWYAAYPDGAEAHNAMWGGRDITAAFNAGTVSEHIADGTFKDIFPGDYITKRVTISGTAYTVNWVVADCDYWINKGDTAMTAHHVAIVPQESIFNFNSCMNTANTTEGGYAGSRMYRETIPACATGIVNAFGSDHILTFRDGISINMDNSHVSSGIPQYMGTPGWWGTWVSVQCNLMSEKMVYGAPICSGGAMDNTMTTRQMSAFRLSERLINYVRWSWWLRDVVSSACFAAVDGNGIANAHYASDVRGVRPFALLR